jgi:hypothetical protein
MTDWKDPLLAKWWAGCSEETRRDIAAVANWEMPAAQVLAWLSAHIGRFPTDFIRLRDLIDAELREGREAKGLLVEVQCVPGQHDFDLSYCPICLSDYPDHDADCRLAKLIAP